MVGSRLPLPWWWGTRGQGPWSRQDRAWIAWKSVGKDTSLFFNRGDIVKVYSYDGICDLGVCLNTTRPSKTKKNNKKPPTNCDHRIDVYKYLLISFLHFINAVLNPKKHIVRKRKNLWIVYLPNCYLWGVLIVQADSFQYQNVIQSFQGYLYCKFHLFRGQGSCGTRRPLSHVQIMQDWSLQLMQRGVFLCYTTRWWKSLPAVQTPSRFLFQVSRVFTPVLALALWKTILKSSQL